MRKDENLLFDIGSRIEAGKSMFEAIGRDEAAMLGYIPEHSLTRDAADRLDYHLRLMAQDGLINAQWLASGIVSVRGLTMKGHDWLERLRMDRNRLLLRMVLLRVQSQLREGVTTGFSAYDDDMTIEGFSTEEVKSHLKMLISHEYVRSPFSQPLDGSVLISGITKSGFDFLELDQDSKPLTIKVQSRKIFIVHGHDDAARDAVARFVEKLEFEAVILHERPNKGRTIISKMQEEAADIAFAVILMTPDDEGGSRGSGKLQFRARQNVVFELGYFIGAIGSQRTAALLKGGVERPSDFEGVVYISMDNGDWQIRLAKELQAAGLSFDASKIF